MSGIYWLASYPKSGNTWLRALLTNYQRQSDEPASINELEGGGIASLRETFDEYTGIDSVDLTQEQIEYYRPSVYERLAADSSKPLFLKVHDAYRLNSDGGPIFPKQATTGVVYLMRNPLDVAVSYSHHRDEPVEETIRVMGRDDAVLAGSDKPGNELPQTLSSWSGHVCSWVEESGLSVHLVRYEDMLQRPSLVLSGIVHFTGLELDAARVEKAVEFSDFGRLQAEEAAFGFSEKQPTAVSFFRSGRSGSWREMLTEAQIRQLTADHREVMHRYRYMSYSGQILC